MQRSKNKQNIGPVEMFSKIGRYISQKIVKIPKNRPFNSTNKLHSCTSLISNINHQPPVSRDQSSPEKERVRVGRSQQFHPSVGYYKIKYSLIDKHLPKVNFKTNKHDSYETTAVEKDIPEGFSKSVVGFKQLKRMTSREDIKGYIRKLGANPNQSRFEQPYDKNYWTDLKAKKTVDFDKILKRDNRMFKNLEFSPDYDVNMQLCKKKLATHLVKFEKQMDRQNQFLMDKTCLSEQFQQGNLPTSNTHVVKFDKLLSRQSQQQLPSYLDKNINSRLALSTRNWSTFKMNCTKIQPK